MFSSFARIAGLLRAVESFLSIQASKAEPETAARICRLRLDVAALAKELDQLGAKSTIAIDDLPTNGLGR